MNLSHLHYFVKLADEKHFANTAKSLFIARSTLSLAISQLERELGAPLFTKNGSTFLLTEYGAEFYRYASLALQNIETGKRNVMSMLDNKIETLRVGVPFALQDENWSRMIREFRNTSNPSVDLVIHQGFSDQLTRDLAAGNLDIIFASKTSAAPDKLDYTPYWTHELVLVVNKDNPLAERTHISLNELQHIHLVSYAEGCPPHDEIQPYFDRFDLDIDYNFKDEITICSMVAADETLVAFVNYSFLLNVFPDVVCIHVDDFPRDFHRFYIVNRTGEPMTHASQRFKKFALSHPIAPGYAPDRTPSTTSDEAAYKKR